jgi:hypothetical protein
MRKKLSIIVAIIIALFLALALFTSCEKKEIVKPIYIQKDLENVRIKYKITNNQNYCFYKYQKENGEITEDWIDVLDTVVIFEMKVLPKSFYYIVASTYNLNLDTATITLSVFENDSLIRKITNTNIAPPFGIEISGQLPK